MKRKTVFLLLFLCSQLVSAQDLKVLGTRQLSLPYVGPNGQEESKTITLPEYQLTDQEKQNVLKHRRLSSSVTDKKMQATSSKLPQKIQLDMAGLPVFDQGLNPYCVVFSSVAAMDIVLNKGDYISPSCLIHLGQYMKNTPNGQDIHRTDILLNLIKNYGIISKAKQKEVGCAGDYDYNPKHKIEGGMTPEEFLSKSEVLYNKQVSWRYLFDGLLSSVFNSNGRILRIKEALNSGQRVILEYLLVPDLGVAGAIGKHHNAQDTWIYSDDIFEQLFTSDTFLGHAVVITGYDDNASAVDPSGKIHRGLFTLRSSWGDRVGDAGDFYMTYEYLTNLSVSSLQVCANSNGKNSSCW